MGTIHQLYPSPKDTLDRGIFLSFKQCYDQQKEQLLQTLLTTRKTSIIANSGQKIICTLQEFYGKNYVANPYGREYHVLLENNEKWFGCHIRRRVHPVTREVGVQGLYPSSWVVNNKKFGILHDKQKMIDYKILNGHKDKNM